MSWLTRLLGWEAKPCDVLTVEGATSPYVPAPEPEWKMTPVPQPTPGQYAPRAGPVLTVGEGASKGPTDPWPGDVPFAAITLSEAFEGRRLAPYLDSAGVWTIGVGSTTTLDGKRVTSKTSPITDTVADVMAMRDLEKAARLVRTAVKAPLSNRQAAALILLANNLGDLTVAAPSLVRAIHAGDWRYAAGLFRNYRNAGGKPSLGLRRRRWAEAAFSLGMDAAVARKRAWAEIGTVDGWPGLPG